MTRSANRRRDAGWGGLAYGLANPRRDFAHLSPVGKDDFAGGGFWIDSWDLRGVPSRAYARHGLLTWLRWSPDGSRISYANRGSIYVLNVATDKTTRVTNGGTTEWFDDHTLIVGPGG